ncbi:hypothetical protein KSD_27810 [Ktedonobacter sp. SOSP1-85]|uniref:N-acetylmuramoyl-L-alanine amidase n=1 Tax=Ktedonobacter sp. SOSP1-85 TaxID=2778367 RepID=UPI00191544F1|nr:peptidoglycan recognition family protein [Ktedonobacter sp. SOSP1-85]GHO75010.1 hypothetical protein KSD_27810 [Ktedonobacter sp. SOSP1-85]
MVDEAGAVWIPSPNYFANRNGYTPKWIIVHGTAGFSSARDVGTYFQTADVSANYVIGQDGTIVQCVSEKDGAWGNGVISTGHDSWWTSSVNPNWVTISIEHVKPHTDNSDTITDAQKAASFRLISHICDRHKIPRRRADGNGGITGHYSIDPVNRSRCPGPYPWDELISYLGSGGSNSGGSSGGSGGSTGNGAMIDLNDEIVARYFEQAGTGRWHCKATNYYIFGGMLNFYCSFGGTGKNGLTYLGMPLMNEYYPDPNAQFSYQRFERGILAYDPNHSFDRPPGAGTIYLMHIDQPLPQGTGLAPGQGQATPTPPAQSQNVPQTPQVPADTNNTPLPQDQSYNQPDPASQVPADTDTYNAPYQYYPQGQGYGQPDPASQVPANTDTYNAPYQPYSQDQGYYQPGPASQVPNQPGYDQSTYGQPNNNQPNSDPFGNAFPSLEAPPKSSLGILLDGVVKNSGFTDLMKRILSRRSNS